MFLFPKAKGYVFIFIEMVDLYLIVKSIIFILNRNGGGDCNNDLFSPASSHVSSNCDAVFGLCSLQQIAQNLQHSFQLSL